MDSMASVSEERRAAYLSKVVGEHVGDAVCSGAAGIPLSPIAEAAEFADDEDDALASRAARPASGPPLPARRASLLAEVRRLSHAAPRASWNFLRESTATAVSYLAPRLAVYSSATLQGLPWRARADYYLSQPEDSSVGWVIQNAVMVVLVANIAIMAVETLDGPRYGSSDPGYTYLPGKTAFVLAEAGFTAVYALEFAVRSAVARHPAQYWKAWGTWLNVLALLPFFPHVALDAWHAGDPAYSSVRTGDRVGLVRISRIARLIVLSQMFLGTKVLFRVSKKVVAPLKITLFFLITVVMVCATAIFYAEPCYDLSTCTFTDIFNAGYFVMVTVATVGYGNQVPSFSHPGALFVACVVMLFGTLYLAMPLAIVGIKYDLAWREYDDKQQKEAARSPRAALAPAEEPVALTPAQLGVDDTLTALATTQTTAAALQLSEQFLEMGQKLLVIDGNLRALTVEAAAPSLEAVAPSLEAAVSLSRQRSDRANKALDAITGVLKLHRRVGKEVREALLAEEPAKRRRSSAAVSDRLLSLTTKRGGSGSSSGRVSTKTGLSKAKNALTAITARVSAKPRVRHERPDSFRARAWDVFEHHDRSWRAAAINRARLAVVILSIVLFYSQTTPELQLTGLRTVLCRRTIEDFCAADAFGQPGCFVHAANHTPTAEPVDFSCAIHADDPSCYGAGANYGSDGFSGTCQAAFGPKGAKRVCRNRLCQPSESFMLDMEPYWVYLEFLFGALFTVEMLLRSLAHPVPSMLLSDLTLLMDLAVLFPFFVETASIIGGVMPIYSVVPTAPSFLTGVRVLKTLRILKVGTHIPGSRVLLKTAELIYRRLLIPLFLLFVGCVVGAAVFYELERGTECFVGQRCVWWGVDVLTPSLAAGRPPGTRVLVQNTEPTTFVDMLRATWFSLVTFTTVGYGDLFPRTALGKLFDILCMIGSACYTAMPLTLVGGQFYVCYEVFVQEEKRRRHGADHQIAPKQGIPDREDKPPDAAAASSDAPVRGRLSLFSSNAPGLVQGPALALELAPMSLAGLASDALAGPEPAAREGATAPADVTPFELQILKQFFLIHKVLNEMIEDMSSLNRLGAERVAALKKAAAAADGAASPLESIAARERAIETKIGDNMVFCATVFLAFASLVERSQGLHGAQDRRASMRAVAAGAMPQAPTDSFGPSTVAPASPLDVQLHGDHLHGCDAPDAAGAATDRTGRVTAVVTPVMNSLPEAAPGDDDTPDGAALSSD